MSMRANSSREAMLCPLCAHDKTHKYGKTSKRLLRELFEAWLQEQLKQLPDSDRIWLGATTNRKVDTSSHLAVA